MMDGLLLLLQVMSTCSDDRHNFANEIEKQSKSNQYKDIEINSVILTLPLILLLLQFLWNV